MRDRLAPMRWRGGRRIVTGAGVGALLAAGVAIAAIDTGDYRLKQKDVALPAETPVAESAQCPRRHRVVPGGAFVHAPGVREPDAALAVNAAVPNSVPAKGMAGWVAAAYKGPGENLRLRVV